MITEKEVLEIHAFDGHELYPTPIDKAAAILESIVKNHPFIDGNKRTGYVPARLLLMNEQLDLQADLENKYQFIISISKGELSFDQIKDGWKGIPNNNFRNLLLSHQAGKPIQPSAFH